MSTFSSPPPQTTHCTLSFPHASNSILLVTLNRPKSLNCISSQGHAELHEVWEWMDAEPSVRVGILTGNGRAFCAGADLKEWNNVSSANNSNNNNNSRGERKPPIPASGFGGISRRTGKKPVVCAVNGIAFGGGCEIIINADMVIASKRARFALPEVKRGVVALAGGLTRLVRTVGRPRAMEMALMGRVVSVEEAERWGLVNEIVEDGEEGEDVDDVMQRKVVKRAVEVALEIAGNSPDAVIVSREGLKLAWEGVGAEEGSRLLMDAWGKKLTDGENMKEGVLAFVEKRSPKWVPSKL